MKDEIAKDVEVLSFEIFAIHQPDLVERIICTACGKKDLPEDMLICDNCGMGQHKECLGELVNPAGFAFYCRHCEEYVYLET